jgi:hypothetical protein
MNRVTVIIAAKAAGRWIVECLRSVTSQQLPPGWQLCVVVGIDACHATLNALRSVPLPPVRVHYFFDHVGPYVIFNSLVPLYGAHAFARFDADDVMLDGYLYHQLSALESVTAPLITQTWSIYVDEQRHPTAAVLSDGRRTPPDGRRDKPSDGQFLMTYPVWARLGGFMPWWCHADSEFLRRAASSGVARTTIPAYLYLRRVHASSLTQSSATGYSSSLRKHYAQHIRRAVHVRTAGRAQWVRPTVATRVALVQTR